MSEVIVREQTMNLNQIPEWETLGLSLSTMLALNDFLIKPFGG